MKSYKDFNKEFIGSSDIASLTLTGCTESGVYDTFLLNFGEDGSYQAYIVRDTDSDLVEIGNHYECRKIFYHWLKIYDDNNVSVKSFYADEIKIYRAGIMGCIIELINYDMEAREIKMRRSEIYKENVEKLVDGYKEIVRGDWETQHEEEEVPYTDYCIGLDEDGDVSVRYDCVARKHELKYATDYDLARMNEKELMAWLEDVETEVRVEIYDMIIMLAEEERRRVLDGSEEGYSMESEGN